MNFFFKYSLVLAWVLGTASAQETSTTTPSGNPAVPITAATKAQAPADLYSLDFDEDTDTYFVSGTKTPFEGPVTAKTDIGGVELTGTLKAGKRDGHWIEFYDDGKKSEEGDYRDGKEVGPWKYWHENGQLDSEGSFSSGKYIGLWKNYYENGKLESKGVFVDGLRSGPWETYDETGTKKIVKYDTGKASQ